MPKLTSLPTQRVIKAMARSGWVLYGGGKHYKLIHTSTRKALAVPRHPRLKPGLVRALIRQAGLTPEQFWELYK